MDQRERRDYTWIALALLIVLFVKYLSAENGFWLALTMIISAAFVIGAYWLGRWRKRGKSKKQADLK